MFSPLVGGDELDIDRRLMDLRDGLSNKYGEGFSWYRRELQEQWQPSRNEWVFPTPLIDITGLWSKG